MCTEGYINNQVSISNLIGVINGVLLSFEIIIVKIIFNASKNKYLLKLSWNNLETHNAGFI